jgi:hypothetical protein
VPGPSRHSTDAGAAWHLGRKLRRLARKPRWSSRLRKSAGAQRQFYLGDTATADLMRLLGGGTSRPRAKATERRVREDPPGEQVRAGTERSESPVL